MCQIIAIHVHSIYKTLGIQKNSYFKQTRYVVYHYDQRGMYMYTYERNHTNTPGKTKQNTHI